MSNRILVTLTSLLLLLALPLTAFAAEREAFNPPGWAGATLFFLALILPIATSIWLRRRR